MARVGLALLTLLVAGACGGGASQTGGGGAGGSANGGTGGGSGGAGTGGSGNTGGSGATGGVPAGLLDPTRTTTWNPGILADDQMHMPLGADGLPARTTICASPAPGADINAAITSCPEGQVVKLAAGTYTVSATIKLNKGVVLRGAGSKGAAMGGTTIVKTGGNSVIQIGASQDQACYASNHGTALALSEDAVKETATVRVASGASQPSRAR